MEPHVESIADVRTRLCAVGYRACQAIAMTVLPAGRVGKPLLVEGRAGVG